MNPIIQYLIVQNIVKRKHRKRENEITVEEFDHEMNEIKVELSHSGRDIIFILLGVLSASFGLKSFLLPNSFIDGGITGISLIVAELTKMPLPYLLVAINIPFIILAFSTVNKRFAVKSFTAIIALAVFIHYLPFTSVTNDKLLIAVFGGFFLGLGIGLAIRGGSVIDGTEVLAVYVSRETSLTIGDIIMILNILIFSVAAYVFSVEIALYAILTYLAASKTVDFVVSGIEEYIGVTIISEKNEEIRLAIIEKLGRGCTLYSGKKGFAKRGVPLRNTNIIYTLVTRLELSKLETEIDKIDNDAFVIMHSVKDAKGGMIKKRPLSK
ncbi:MAG: YitT family protein [Bacteroidota bacterium]|nr:YitT family protein [Bacteroidota bacterium]